MRLRTAEHLPKMAGPRALTVVLSGENSIDKGTAAAGMLRNTFVRIARTLPVDRQHTSSANLRLNVDDACATAIIRDSRQRAVKSVWKFS